MGTLGVLWIVHAFAIFELVEGLIFAGRASLTSTGPPYVAVHNSVNYSLPDCSLYISSNLLGEVGITSVDDLYLKSVKLPTDETCRDVGEAERSITDYFDSCNPIPEQNLYIKLLAGLAAINKKLCLDSEFNRKFSKYVNCLSILPYETESCKVQRDWFIDKNVQRRCRSLKSQIDCFHLKSLIACGEEASELYRQLMMYITSHINDVPCSNLIQDSFSGNAKAMELMKSGSGVETCEKSVVIVTYMSDNDNLSFPALPVPFDCDLEWEYPMRRTMQEILPGLYLGPFSSAAKTQLQNLMDCGITHIVCVRHTLEAQYIKPNFEGHFKYFVVELADKESETVIPHFARVKEFVDDGLGSDGKVLIHSNAGMSRSVVLVLAYIMQKYGLTVQRAHDFVQKRRLCVNPNNGFMKQLKEFEPIYQAQMINRSLRSPTSIKDKRTFDELEVEEKEKKKSVFGHVTSFKK